MPKSNPTHVKYFYVLDLDRTLFDTVGAANAWLDLIEKEDPDLARYIHGEVDDTLHSATSFSIREALVGKGGEEFAQKIDQALIEYGKVHNLRLEGADELIDFASQDNDSAAGILTYGSAEGQRLKVRAAGFDDIPVMVTDQQHKGTLISGWFSEGKYHLPDTFGSMTADAIIFVDDRIFSFEGIREDVIGYWVTQDISVLDEIGYPPNVTPVSSLTKIIEAELERRGL